MKQRKDLARAEKNITNKEINAKAMAVVARQELTYGIEFISDEEIERELGLQPGMMSTMKKFEDVA
jgi:hypothetical protein